VKTEGKQLAISSWQLLIGNWLRPLDRERDAFRGMPEGPRLTAHCSLLIAKEKTHRMLAWGVLGSASDGYRFSLLTLLFSGVFQ
jgi:hypothetical protein